MERGSYDYRFKPAILAENTSAVSALSAFALMGHTILLQALTVRARGGDIVSTLLHAIRQEAEFETVPDAGQSVTAGHHASHNQRSCAAKELHSLRPPTRSLSAAFSDPAVTLHPTSPNPDRTQKSVTTKDAPKPASPGLRRRLRRVQPLLCHRSQATTFESPMRKTPWIQAPPCA